ncbi:MAG: DJ-1 family glyoxalase III, partial [Sarcina sp.]
MKKVLILLAEGFEILEALSVVDVCVRAGITCHTCSIASKEVKSSHGITIISDKVFDECELLSYDALVLPGGMPGSTNLRDNIRVLELVREYNSAGRIVAAVCAAPIVLAEAGIVSGKKITSYPGFESQLGNCIYVTDEIVVVDENIITSRGPGTSLEFALEIIKQLGFIKEAESIKEGM